MPNTRKLVAVLDEQDRLIAVMDPFRASVGMGYDVKARAGQTLYEIDVPATVGPVAPKVFREAVTAALALPGARTPYLGRRPAREGSGSGSGKPD